MQLVGQSHPKIRFSAKESLREFLDLVSANGRFVLGVDFLGSPTRS